VLSTSPNMAKSSNVGTKARCYRAGLFIFSGNCTYCRDNPPSCFDWSLVERHQDVCRFFKHMIVFRKRHSILHRPRFFSGEANERGIKDIVWHGTVLDSPGCGDPTARALAFTLGGFGGEPTST
jgi:isoamylase